MEITKDEPIKVICIGGGHCNCQLLKILKKNIQENGLNVKLTLVSESEFSFYSGMLPGCVSGLYKHEELSILLSPLATWCKADFVQ